LIVEEDVPVCGGVEESVALSEMVELPTAVGVPEITPVEEFRVRPAGSEPEATVQVSGAVAPEAATVAL
jgi:hypothetical protein